MSGKKIAVLGTFDTKGAEHRFVARELELHGHEVLLIDVGTGDGDGGEVDFDRFAVAAAGGIELWPLLERADRGACVTAMGAGAKGLLRRLVEEGEICGVISLGGGGGTSIGSAAMRDLPLGFPKMIVSTLASGDTAKFVGESDLILVPSIVDVAGLNRVSRGVFRRAAAALAAMVETGADEDHETPLVVVSMFGNTTKCVDQARVHLEAAGFEVLVFHATGTGGRAMEKLIRSGMVSGVLDLTTTEWADELVGGILGAGPDRGNAAADLGVPLVMAPGCVDMVNFGAPDSVPEKFSGRTFYHHNPQATLMRTTAAENSELGRILAEKLNRHAGPAEMLIPLKGVSVIGESGGPFYDSAADEALFEAIREGARHPVTELDVTINDPAFAELAVNKLLGLMEL